MMNNNNIALKLKTAIHILFVFGRMIVLIIRIWPNSKYPLFGAALISCGFCLLYLERAFNAAVAILLWPLAANDTY